MLKQKFPLKLNIQFFADEAETKETESQDKETENNADQQQEKENKQEEKLFTQAEVDKIAADRAKRAEKDKEKAIEEAAKLAKMNADEKKEYEFKKLQDELAELKKKDAFYGLSKEATKMLTEEGIAADDELLAFVVKDTAEDTQTAVNAFVGLVNKKVEEGVKKALAGESPKVTTQKPGAVTKEAILAMKDSSARIKAIQDNPHLFKK
ncbi:DUF4355 domain-containing protein [Planococcus sp. A6]|uniref:DUF4355 domain-containing protein n=1 Tax=Planococcus sp. A6 TaxID=2992760 RepID=UPI00237B0447|nr:DUF4355 domain-containing protein [Planococcus sp. A6]MDE0582234.1 DUF4355 domain-containing protein [Planococcus sp. A6]